MTIRTIETATFDAWRIGATVSAFLFFLAFGALTFGAHDQEAFRRCMSKDSSQADLCMLTVYGR